MTTVKVKSSRESIPLHNFWNHIHFHPTDAIEDEWGQKILENIYKDNVAKTVRMYTMLEDIVSMDENGNLVYDYTLNDVRLDYMVEHGWTVLLCYNFIPPCISSDPEELSRVCKNATRYKGKFIVTAPPYDWDLWEEICRNYTEHIVDRYGIETVSKWHLQCFNEPDYQAFFMRKAKSTEERAENYCKLYHRFVNALEAVSPKLSPVGPALAYEFTFFGIFLDYVKKNNLRLDYITFHSYGVHPHKLSVEGLNVNQLYDEVMKRIDFARDRGFVDTPFLLDEWGAATCGYFNNEENPDLIFRETEVFSAYFAKTIINFEEKNVPLDKMLICLAGQHEMKTDFSGFRGFFTLNGFPKPIYNAYVLASKIGNKKLSVEKTVENKNLSVLASECEHGISILGVYAAENFKEALPELDVEFDFSEIKAKKKIKIWKIDKYNANAYSAFLELGSPENLSQENIDYIMEKSKLECEEFDFSPDFRIRLCENAVILIEIF